MHQKPCLRVVSPNSLHLLDTVNQRSLFVIVVSSIPFRKTLTTILLELPVSIVQWTDLTCLQPPGDAMEVECVVADTPSHSTLLASCRCLICLTFDAEIHDVISADCTIVDNNIPSPESHSRPLLDLKTLLSIRPAISSAFGLANSLLRRSNRSRGSIGHIYVRHSE